MNYYKKQIIIGINKLLRQECNVKKNIVIALQIIIEL